jgi:hypothetical protein
MPQIMMPYNKDVETAFEESKSSASSDFLTAL